MFIKDNLYVFNHIMMHHINVGNGRDYWSLVNTQDHVTRDNLKDMWTEELTHETKES